MSRSVITWLGCCLSLVASIAFAAPSEQSIKQSIQRAMDEFQVPGMAVSVVHGGSVIYSGGLGVREVGKKGAVDDRTLFRYGPDYAPRALPTVLDWSDWGGF